MNDLTHIAGLHKTFNAHWKLMLTLIFPSIIDVKTEPSPVQFSQKAGSFDPAFLLFNHFISLTYYLNPSYLLGLKSFF